MAVFLSPVFGVAGQVFDDNGNPLAGGKIYTYLAGTTTPAATYTTSMGSIAHTNPIVLDGAGRVPSGEIWLTDGIVYKFVVEDANNVLIGTYDNITGINSNFVAFTNEQEIQTATAGQTVFNLATMQYQPGTNSLSVFVDGVNQYGPGAQYAYVETDSNTVTFVSGLHVGASVKFTTSQLNTSGAIDASQVSYTPPFIDSVITNVEDKLAQTVSVKDFGAVGDGVTDDTAAIEAAIGECKGVDKPALYFPAGVYCFTESTPNFGLYIDDAIKIFGDGPTRTTLKNTSATGAGVRCASGFITISDLTIDNNSSTGIAFRMGGQYSVTRNLQIKNQAGASFAFVADGSTLASIYDLHLFNCSNGISIAATQPTQYLTFTNISIEVASGEALTIGASTSIKFYGLYIEPKNGVTNITHAIKATNAVDLNFYELSTEVFGGLTNPSQAWIQFDGCKTVNLFGGRFYNSTASNNTVFYLVNGANTRNINFDGLEIRSVGTGQTLFNVADNPYQVNWKNITTFGTVTGTGINYTNSGNGISVINWFDSNSAYSLILDSNDVFVCNTQSNINIANRTNLVLVNCRGAITGAGAANLMQLDNLISTTNSFRPKTDQTIASGGASNRWSGVFSDKLALTDGVTAPGTVAGIAQIYVDTADGDLKVKFGDGTVKTIVTD